MIEVLKLVIGEVCKYPDAPAASSFHLSFEQRDDGRAYGYVQTQPLVDAVEPADV